MTTGGPADGEYLEKWVDGTRSLLPSRVGARFPQNEVPKSQEAGSRLRRRVGHTHPVGSLHLVAGIFRGSEATVVDSQICC